MKLQLPILLLAVLPLVAAHTVFTTLYINDVSQGDGTCIRMPMTPGNASFPINDLESNDMACGREGSVGVARVCPVDSGAKLSFLFREYANGATNGSIDVSHKGPCAVYAKKTESAISSTAIGDGWIKIWHEGHDEALDNWCTDRLIQNNGLLSVNLPQEMAGGSYLLRAEILALHQADKHPPNPQFYVGCAQIFLKSVVLNKVNSQDTVSIPGYTNISDSAVLFNIYTPKFPYTPPGPPILPAEKYNVFHDLELVPNQSEGLLPPGAVLVNANWWGLELDAYTDEAGCNQAARNCFAQSKTCYNAAPPTGSTGCAIWDRKCMNIQHNCDGGNWTGPPDQGKYLNPIPVFNITNIPDAEFQASTLTTSFQTSSSSFSTEYITSLTIVQAPAATVVAYQTFTSAFQQSTTPFISPSEKSVQSLTVGSSPQTSFSSSTALASSSVPATRKSLEIVTTVSIIIAESIGSHLTSASLTSTSSFSLTSAFEHSDFSLNDKSSTLDTYSSEGVRATSTISAIIFNTPSPVSLENFQATLSGHQRSTSVRFRNSTMTARSRSFATSSLPSLSPNFSTFSAPTQSITPLSIVPDVLVGMIDRCLHQSTVSTHSIPTSISQETTIPVSNGLCGPGSDRGKGSQVCSGTQQRAFCCGIDGTCGNNDEHCGVDTCQPQFVNCGSDWVGVSGEIATQRRGHRRSMRWVRHNCH